MPALAEIEAQAMELTESQRARLAASLLSSLPAILFGEDEGLAEARRRDAEMDLQPTSGMTPRQLQMALGRLRNGYHLGGNNHAHDHVKAF